jgi:hypothetical protein
MFKKPDNLPHESLEINSKLKLFQIYKNLKYTSLKIDSYFQVYEEIFSRYVGKKITFVEVGILGGGSLQMWKEFFGDKARIIGIDMHPEAKKLEKDGFEIFIGSQSDENFWNNFYRKVGKIDILLDDGGHQNKQQILTLSKSINNINDGGLIVVEDTHTSYMKKFGNPSKVSFISFAKHLIDKVNYRFLDSYKKKLKAERKIFSINFYESIVAFNINSKKTFLPTHLKNIDNPVMDDTFDYGFNDNFPAIQNTIEKKYPKLKHIPVIKKIIRYLFYTKNFFIRIKDFLYISKFFR